MFNDVSKKKRMPQLFTAKIQTKLLKNKDQFKSWWRQLTQKSNKSSSSDASSHTTLDWRSLSPDRPPLPFFLPESPTSSTTSIDRSIITYPTTTTTTNITPNNNNTTLDIEAKRYSNNTNNITNNTTTSNNNKVNIFLFHIYYIFTKHTMIILCLPRFIICIPYITLSYMVILRLPRAHYMGKKKTLYNKVRRCIVYCFVLFDHCYCYCVYYTSSFFFY